MKKHIAKLAAAFVLGGLVLFAACSGSENGEDLNGEANGGYVTPSPTPGPTPAPTPVMDPPDWSGGRVETTEADFEFEFNEEMGGIVITGYIGTALHVRIPDTIDGRPVVGIGGADWFYADDAAFSNSQILSVEIPDTVTYIGQLAFFNSWLSSIVIPDSVTHLGMGAFFDSLITTAVIGNGVTQIGIETFRNTPLTSVTIGSGVRYISEASFAFTRLESVTIPDNVVTIRGEAFAETPLTSINIGSGVSQISRGVFVNTPLENITVAADNPVFFDRDGVLYMRQDDEIVLSVFPAARTGEYIIPDDVSRIASSAFFQSSLWHIAIGRGVRHIESGAFESAHLRTITFQGSSVNIETRAFASNLWLETVNFHGGALGFTINMGAFIETNPDDASRRRILTINPNVVFH